MKRAKLLAGCVVLYLFAGVSGARAELASSPREIWSQATAALDTGDLEGASAKLTALLESAKSLGIQRFPLYAQSAAALARQAHKQGNANVANWAISAARRLDPIDANVAFAAADLARDQSNWSVAVRSFSSGLSRMFADYTTSVVAQADLVLILCMAVLATAAIFSIILFFRYARPAAHDFREILFKYFSASVTTVLAFAVLFLPIFLWLGPMWLFLFWFALFFPYANIRERVLSVILLLMIAAVPVVLHWTAFRIVAVNSPVVQGAAAGMERSYNPETLQRMRELTTALPQEGDLHLLLGNLEVQDGNEQEASNHYRKATELNPRLAGAFINIGNLHFFNNDFAAAANEYQKAQQIDPTLAIAYYNQSVASGELYKFSEQGGMIEQAKKHDRGLIENLLASPPPQKVVQYTPPMSSAWNLAEKIAGTSATREIFGNYAKLYLNDSALSILTLAALVSLLSALALGWKRRGTGVAGSCLKCGRTFCSRCKSSRESATYCTQCIHIYLKRDGVSLDTKRSKLDEVQDYQGGTLRTKKILASFLPGSGQIYEGSTLKGVAALLLFLVFVLTAIFIGRLAPIVNPAEVMRLAVRTLAVVLAVLTWAFVSFPLYKQKSMAA